MTNRESVVALAISSLGKDTQSSIVTAYNRIKPLPRGYLMKPNDNWCAAWVSVMYHILGLYSAIHLECSCNYMLTFMGDRRTNVLGSRPGDLVFYDWNGNYHPDHVGIIIHSENNFLAVCEGNLDGRVGMRYIDGDDSRILTCIRSLLA